MALTDLPILITRAEPGASETAARLQELARNPVLAPMLSLEVRLSVEVPRASSLSGLVFTSANGVRTYAAQRDDRTLPAWCVGPATAAAARASGFEQIRQSSGNADDLARFILKERAPDDRPLLHVANAAAAGGLKRSLEAAGLTVVFAPLYDMAATTAFSDTVQDLLTRAIAGIILIHSAKGAMAFATLARDYDLSGWRAVVISKAAAMPLSALNLQDIAIAEHPDEDGLFAALATLSA